MRSLIFITAALLVAATAWPCHAQFVRVPVVVIPRPHVPFHVPHFPHGSNSRGDDGSGEALFTILGGVGLTAVLCGGFYLIQAWRKKRMPRARIRIIGVPPGEGPVWVRYAWLCLELPLIDGQVRAESIAVEQVLSHRPATPPLGYAVDGKTAIAILAAASPEAAAWWRQWVPAVLTPGYQLVFPATVCERLDDLGT